MAVSVEECHDAIVTIRLQTSSFHRDGAAIRVVSDVFAAADQQRVTLLALLDLSVAVSLRRP